MIAKIRRRVDRASDQDARITHWIHSLRNAYSDKEWLAFTDHYDATEDLSSADTTVCLRGLCKLFGLGPLDHPKEAYRAVEQHVVQLLARRQVEMQVDQLVATAVQERQQAYYAEIRREVLRPASTTENAQTLKKYAQLEKIRKRSLGESCQSVLRPRAITDLIGQTEAVESLVAKLASPFPQHILIYGPPGVGKTSAARLALQLAEQYRRSRFGEGAPFVEVDATSLRHDPRDIANPLLGSVHDPIYQGAHKALAEHAVPEPKLGLVTNAHGGVLFIDEIGELDPAIQAQLLKVLEDKHVSFQSPYFDPHDERVPLYIKELFERGAPADFILIGATTRDPSEIDPALRSRCAEVYFRPLGPTDVAQIVRSTAERMGTQIPEEAVAAISCHATDGRKAVGILSDAYARAAMDETHKAEDEIEVSVRHVQEALRGNRLVPSTGSRVGASLAVGRVFGLGVSGFVGRVMEFEAVASAATHAGEGGIRFNESAGQMTKDSVSNAISILRRYAELDLRDFDIHVNIIGGGRVDGPSAGVALCLVMASAALQAPLPQNIACTGEISLQGEVRAVGGVAEKVYAALYAGIQTVYIPKDNLGEVPTHIGNLTVCGISHIKELLAVLE
ncbi:MAG: Lon family ATP-dependent protease [Firmicutes bacterium]|nr:Lon family ATP-dependent protease [Bacillota bacterium]